jgi:hypothetical protein
MISFTYVIVFDIENLPAEETVMSDITSERTRINVRDGNNKLLGWFVLESATEYRERIELFYGDQGVSINTGDTDSGQTLYRTKRGQWVLNHWGEGTPDRHEFIDEDAAKQWLILNDEDAAVQEHFGPLEEESGPNLGGRPEIGPRVPPFAVPKPLLDRVDTYAEDEGISRAEAMRRLLGKALHQIIGTPGT